MRLQLCTASKEKKSVYIQNGGTRGGTELFWRLGAIIDHAFPIAKTIVAAREDDVGANQTELGEQVAQAHRTLQRDIILVVSIRNADCLRDVRLADHIVEPLSG